MCLRSCTCPKLAYHGSWILIWLASLSLISSLSPAAPPFPEFVDPNPNPGNQFGHSVVPLSTGNVVITSPNDDAGGLNAGAVYLFNGTTGELISTLRGASVSDYVGSGGVTVLSNGNYVVSSPNWDNTAASNAGAVTWGSGSSGVSGVVNSSNSLVGVKASDQVGNGFITALSNGNYVVGSPYWDNGTVINAGAVTWGNGGSGVSGVISSSNSLVGSQASDQVGQRAFALSNGNYVVCSSSWDNGAVADVGAVTWGSGTSGVKGIISISNSLVGSSANDGISDGGVTVLGNGNYVVCSSYWDNGTVVDAGAVTWCNGSSGVSGAVSASNSLVGSTANDFVGGVVEGKITALSNGNYVVRSPDWDNGAMADAGAVTWGSGSSGVSGVVSSSNSLVGSKAGDEVGSQPMTVLSNGNYVVSIPSWDNGAVVNVGAVTWGSGTSGVNGVVSPSNSLVGGTANDRVGTNNSQGGYEGVTALSNGNYVVRSPDWDNGAVVNVGAVTWGSGSSGVSGLVNSINSLVGSTANDQVGSLEVTALSNGNYVVNSPSWDNGSVIDAGAVTWGNGSSGMSGEVSISNSLVGSKAYDEVGTGGVTALNNGNYVVCSFLWDNGGVMNAGAVTWGSGSSGVSGVVSSSNSLVGSSADDQVGRGGVTALSNGNYVISSQYWANGGNANVGAVTWGNGSSGVSGAVSSSNSLVGSTTGDLAYSWGVTELSNGNYVVSSQNWDNGTVVDAGAMTWGSGSSGVSGVISSSNSLVGSKANDQVGNGKAMVLSNGNYVVRSFSWDNGVLGNAGALTWGNGNSGVSGEVSASNSLVGLAASTSLNAVVVDDVNRTFFGRFLNEGSGKVRLGSQLNGLSPAPTVTLNATDLTRNATSLTITGANFDDATPSNNTVAFTPAGTGIVTAATATSLTVTSLSGLTLGPLNAVVTTNGESSGVAVQVANIVSLAPTALALSNNSLAENNPVNATVATLSATDPDSEQGHTFSLVEGIGDTDNDLFSIDGTDLKISVIADYETKSSYSLRVRADDGEGGVFEQALTLTILDGPDPVIAISGSDQLITNGDTTPDVIDATDFGTVALDDSSVTHVFTIENDGEATLHLTDPAVILSGPGADDFQVTLLPAAAVDASEQTTFAITFDPRLPGERTATATVTSDDGVNGSYSFAIRGFGGLSKPLAQTITFAPPTTVYLNQEPLNLSATASSGLPVTLSVVPAGTTAVGASLEGDVLSFTTIGKVKVQAVQAGDSTYAAAKTVVKTITVKATPTKLTLLDLAQTYTGTPRAITTIGGSGNVTIEYKLGTSFGSTPPTEAGKYSVKATDNSGSKTGTLVITKVPLYVTPDHKRKFAGEDNPELTVVYSGFLGSDTEAVFTKTPVLKTTAKTTSGGGLYPITASGGAAANYLFVYQQGTLVVESFAGSYEALLVDADDLPVGKLMLTVPLTGQSFSGKLMTVTETAALSLKGELTTDVDDELATGTATVTKGAGAYEISFTLPMQGDVFATVTRDDEPLGSAETGRKLLALAKGSTVLYSGAHTVVLEPALPAAEDVPAGAGWATATLSKTGVMTLTGKLADGTAFTTTLAPDVDPDPGYRLFVQPYKQRTESYLGGAFTLLPHPSQTNRRYVEEASLGWSKTGLAADATYRAGIRPVTTVMMLDPWLPPVVAKGSTPAITLASRLGLTESAFGVQHSDTLVQNIRALSAWLQTPKK